MVFYRMEGRPCSNLNEVFSKLKLVRKREYKQQHLQNIQPVLTMKFS